MATDDEVEYWTHSESHALIALWGGRRVSLRLLELHELDRMRMVDALCERYPERAHDPADDRDDAELLLAGIALGLAIGLTIGLGAWL